MKSYSSSSQSPQVAPKAVSGFDMCSSWVRLQVFNGVPAEDVVAEMVEYGIIPQWLKANALSTASKYPTVGTKKVRAVGVDKMSNAYLDGHGLAKWQEKYEKGGKREFDKAQRLMRDRQARELTLVMLTGNAEHQIIAQEISERFSARVQKVSKISISIISELMWDMTNVTYDDIEEMDLPPAYAASFFHGWDAGMVRLGYGSLKRSSRDMYERARDIAYLAIDEYRNMRSLNSVDGRQLNSLFSTMDKAIEKLDRIGTDDTDAFNAFKEQCIDMERELDFATEAELLAIAEMEENLEVLNAALRLEWLTPSEHEQFCEEARAGTLDYQLMISLRARLRAASVEDAAATVNH